MGALIKGDPRGEKRYTIAEIKEATGMTSSLLQSRRKVYGIQSNQDGYTYEDVKKMMQRPAKAKGIRPKEVRELREKLKNDGFA